MVKDYKKQAVREIAAKLKDSKAIIFVDYKGIDTAEDTVLRNKMRESDVTYFVAKNTFIKIALNELGIESLNDYLTGPTAVATSTKDEVSAARELAKFKKDVVPDKDILKFKIGLINNKIMEPAQLEQLAKLPPKEVLLAQVLQGFNAPISGLVGALQGIIRKFVYVIDAIKEEKEKQ
jgi:large subunit ribosomal protein L10